MYSIVKNPEFTPYSPKYLDIDDLVIVFYDGKKWKVVSIEDMYQHPVIYDKYLDDDISITFCPFSHSSIVYFDKWIPTKEIINNNIVLQYKKDKNIKISQLSGKFIRNIGVTPSEDYDTTVIRRNEVVIMKISTVLKNYPDCLYFNNTKKTKSIIPKNYLDNKKIINPISHKSNDFEHPKKLVYGIIYSIDNTTSVIISKKNKMDFDESGYQDYFDDEIKIIKENGGFIIPCLLFSWMDNFPDSTIVRI